MGLLDRFFGKQEEAPIELPPAPPAPTVADIETALNNSLRMTLERGAPAVVTARVIRITNTVRGLLPYVAKMGLASTDAYHIIATATDYLPESLEGYLSLPRDWADTREVVNGKSSLLLLIDQLDLLAATTAKMFDAANRNDAAALVTHGRFLDQKFGGHRTDEARMEITRIPSANPLDLD